MTAIKKAELLAGCVCAGLARRSLSSFLVLIDDGAEKKNLDLGEGGGESTRSRVACTQKAAHAQLFILARNYLIPFSTTQLHLQRIA